MKKLFLSIVACFLVGNMAMAQSWVSFTNATPEAPIVNLTGSDNQSVSFTVEVCGMYKQDITEGSETFQRVSIPSHGSLKIQGEPELPVIRQLIAIPECTNVTLSVNISGQTTFSNYNIYPVPALQEVQNADGTVYMEEVFTKDAAAYAQNLYLPGVNAEIVSTGYLRDQKYAEVFIYPVQFNPVLGQLTVYKNYQLILSFTNPSTAVNLNTGIFNNVATNTMLNYVSSGIRASINDNVQGNGNVQWITLTDPAQADDIVADYLIICAEPFFEPNNPNSEVLRIADHRANYNGFDVAILNANNVISDELGFFYEDYPDPDYKKEQRIRTCIRRIYEGSNAQHTYDGKLGYVLLIGDSDYPGNLGMPSSFDHNYGVAFPSDYYYSCLTQDNTGAYDATGDLFIGRFAVDNNESTGFTELHNIVEKTIFFETEYTFDDWRNTLLNIYGYNPGNPSPNQQYFDLYEDFMNELIMENQSLEVIDATYGDDITQEIIDAFNDGSNYGLYFGHGGTQMWTNNTGSGGATTIEEIQQGLTSSYKNPVIFSLACQTGWFDGNTDCFGEALTTYSADKGFVGFLGSARSVYLSLSWPIYEPESLQEFIPYSLLHNLSFIVGECILESKIIANEGESISYVFNYFGDPALNIMAHGYQITQDVELPLSTTISSKVTVKNNAQLIVPAGGELFFENNGGLIIENGAILKLKQYATITGNSPDQIIAIDGGLMLYSQVTFNSLAGTEWGGLRLNNLTRNYFISNSNFERCDLSGESKKLTLTNCSFNNAGLKYTKGDLIVQNSNFDNSRIEAINGGSKSSFVEIKLGCTVQNCEQESAIYIDGYYNYTIDDCTISGNDGDGIGIFNSGGTIGTKRISNNSITNNGWGNLGSGIKIYRSYVQIYGDQLIEGNKYGITCLNNSNVSIRGNSLANGVNETQIIRDNNKYQVYATQNSFPYDFHWNAVIDEDNQYPLVYYSVPGDYQFEELDVRNNYWGTNFTPSEDLYPLNKFVYIPIWDFNIGDDNDDAKALYNVAQANIEQENFSGAKSAFQQIITDYPSSKFAQAALREIFSIEEYASNDYAGLKTFYSTETTIQSNPALAKLADYLTNFCEIKIENYSSAISWFENVIQNPETIEDSIFAIIDLGYTYFLMENGGLKSTYSGNLTEHIPESKPQFEGKRDYLLSLIYKDSKTNKNLDNELTKPTEGEITQNFPNPFSGTTKIWYKLENISSVQLNIYNYTGQLISSINEGTKTKGNHYIAFDASGLTNGIYFYSISINGHARDSKKMTIMK